MTTQPTYTERRNDDPAFTSHTLSADGICVAHIIPDERTPHTVVYVHHLTGITTDRFGWTLRTGRGTVRIHLMPNTEWPAPDPDDLNYTTHKHPVAPR